MQSLENMDIQDKAKYLLENPLIQSFLSSSSEWAKYITSLADDDKVVLLSLVFLKQNTTIFHTPPSKWPKGSLQKLLSNLKQVESFYEKIGGIIGYHETFIKLLNDSDKDTNTSLYPPEPIDIRQFSSKVKEKAEIGLKHLDQIAFIFPVGGAGDRLNLIDKKTKKALPAAFLSFCGKTLLQYLLDEVSALEHLYKSTYKKDITCPVILMTSEEKDNDEKVTSFLEKNDWFGRAENSIKTCIQPVVPVISETGKWILQDDYTLLCKPGGHGALWKVLLENKIFDYLISQKKKYSIIRQINNPIGGMDYNLLTFIGYGLTEKKKFGFLTCPRQVHSATGSILLNEKKEDESYQYNHTNIEYCDFEKYHISDVSTDPYTNISEYPANTNTLFVDLKEAYPIVKENPLFEMSLNIKHSYRFKGKKKEERIGRPELLMQNISNRFVYTSKQPLEKGQQKHIYTFLMSNERRKTLGSIKQLLQKDKIMETPESCLHSLLENYKELLTKWCSFSMPEMFNYEECLKKGPPFFINISPFLGPTFEEVAKKIQGGEISEYSVLELLTGFVEIKNLKLHGNLHIKEKKRLASKCYLHNITITNKINKKPMQAYWKDEISHKNGFSLFLEEGSEFFAENIHFDKVAEFFVPSNHRMIIEGKNKNWKAKLYPIK